MSKEAYKRWYESNKDKAREQKRAIMKRLRAENPEKYASQSRKAKEKLRQSVLNAHGRACAICGFENEHALTLDHILNNGAEERKEVGERGVYYRSLIPENKSEYRILCMNCQFIERRKVGRQNQWPRWHSGNLPGVL
jgi:hypothetical protein